jgi:pSer/pThr/pTyr-binding forkhead associated (FHA) protein
LSIFNSRNFFIVIYYNKSKGEIFLYDLDSAHGTIVNKQRIPPQHFTKLRTGDQLKFGESTRAYILMGPEEPQPELPESKRTSKQSAEKVTGVTW